MSRLWRVGVVVLTVAAVAAASSTACRGGSSGSRQVRKRLNGTWLWRQGDSTGATVVELVLTAGGRYTKTTYREIGGKRKLVYIHPLTHDAVPKPDTPEAVKKLEAENYRPAQDEGRYELLLAETPQRIIFESESLTGVEVAESMGTEDRTFVLHSEDRLLIGGRTYQRLRSPIEP